MLLEAVGVCREAMLHVGAARHYSRGGTGGQKLGSVVRAQVLQVDKRRLTKACLQTVQTMFIAA